MDIFTLLVYNTQSQHHDVITDNNSKIHIQQTNIKDAADMVTSARGIYLSMWTYCVSYDKHQ